MNKKINWDVTGLRNSCKCFLVKCRLNRLIALDSDEYMVLSTD